MGEKGSMEAENAKVNVPQNVKGVRPRPKNLAREVANKEAGFVTFQNKNKKLGNILRHPPHRLRPPAQ